jgi:hypothetical protein
MFAAFGAAGQTVYNMSNVGKPALKPEASSRNKWLSSKWSPVKILSDDEYEQMLQEKLLRVNAEITLVDESIQALRCEEAKETLHKKQNPGQGQ